MKAPGQQAPEGRQQPGEDQQQPEPGRVGQGHCQQAPEQPVPERAPEFFFDIAASCIDQVHVIDAGGAGSHAGQAGQAPVDMADYFFGRCFVMFQHVFQQVDTAARTVQFIAKQFEGRAGGVAETAMHAFTQDAVGFVQSGVCQLCGGEFGAHC